MPPPPPPRLMTRRRLLLQPLLPTHTQDVCGVERLHSWRHHDRVYFRSAKEKKEEVSGFLPPQSTTFMNGWGPLLFVLVRGVKLGSRY